ncbi:UNVERIFIED_CONTAM: hypothetical protein O8I53_09515 [Campylobacter lari]
MTDKEVLTAFLEIIEITPGVHSIMKKESVDDNSENFDDILNLSVSQNINSK